MEHFLSAIQERDQFWTISVAADRQGRLLGIRGEFVHDNGAYTPYGVVVPIITACQLPRTGFWLR